METRARYALMRHQLPGNSFRAPSSVARFYWNKSISSSSSSTSSRDENNPKLTWAHPKHEIELSQGIFSRFAIIDWRRSLPNINFVWFARAADLSAGMSDKKNDKKCWPKTLRNAIISRCIFIAKRRETERHEKCVWRQEDGLTTMMFHFLGGMILTSKNHHEIE